MKLQQLKYLLAIVDNGLNITAAAQALYTSQPGVSKQLKLLEEELGLSLFERKGKSLHTLTDAGRQIVSRARLVLQEVANIKNLAHELNDQERGVLNIATTHTQARYVLPDVLGAFHKLYPGVVVNLQQGTSEQIAEMIDNGSVDFAIASGSSRYFHDLVMLPCFEWDRIILVPQDHPLRDIKAPDITDLACYPIIGYTFSFDDHSSLLQAFSEEKLQPNVVFTASDPDVIKAHVRQGMGLGIVACMAYDREADADLHRIRGDRMFPSCMTWVGFKRDHFLREYMYEFIRLLAPRWTQNAVQQSLLDLDSDDNTNSLVPLPAVADTDIADGGNNDNPCRRDIGTSALYV